MAAMRRSVDVAKGKATLGPASVSFYKDAAFCIAEEFKKNRERADALDAVASAIRSKSHIFGTVGAATDIAKTYHWCMKRGPRKK